ARRAAAPEPLGPLGARRNARRRRGAARRGVARRAARGAVGGRGPDGGAGGSTRLLARAGRGGELPLAQYDAAPGAAATARGAPRVAGWHSAPARDRRPAAGRRARHGRRPARAAWPRAG